MLMMLAPTDGMVELAGQTLRVWTGTNDDGRTVTALIARIIVSGADGGARRHIPTSEAVRRISLVAEAS